MAQRPRRIALALAVGVVAPFVIHCGKADRGMGGAVPPSPAGTSIAAESAPESASGAVSVSASALASAPGSASGAAAVSASGAVPAMVSASVAASGAVPATVPATVAAPGAASASASAGAPPSASADAPPGMVDIPAGIFLMGSRMSQGSPEEHPMHEVIVASFYLDKTEVTTEAYLACVEAGACPRTYEDHTFCNLKDPKNRGQHPINCVDWNMADKYCAFAKKRLPTEREWEYAARGGAEERRYSWGDQDIDIEQRACYHHRGSCAVGSFAAGAFGLFDMSGNVWEWTSSWYGPYPDEAKTGSYRVYRGGSWSRRFPKWLANMMRNRYSPEKQSASVGFRCAMSKPELMCPADADAKDGVCVRARGKTMCEPSYAWNGEACTFGGLPTLAGAKAVAKLGDGASAASGASGASGAGPADKPAEPKATDPITQTRTPQFDGDCHANWPKKPAAYKFSGATFHARNKPLEAAGCTRRDMGLTWTSACCPQ